MQNPTRIDPAPAKTQGLLNVGDDGAAVQIPLSNAGFDNDAVAQIGLNIFVDYLNHIAGRDIDFPSANSKVALATWPGRLQATSRTSSFWRARATRCI